MTKNNVDLYIYLARRDKSGIRIIARLLGREQLPTRLDDASLLGLQLPPTWNTELSELIYNNRMLWEPWIESISSFKDFRTSLKKRGYSNIPISSQPEFTASTVQSQVANLSYLPQNKTMLRRV